MLAEAPSLRADAVGGDQRHEVGGRVTLLHAPPGRTRVCLGRGRVEAIAVGYNSTSAPMSAMLRALSGNHWSQQIPYAGYPCLVCHTLNPVSPGVK